MVVRDADGDGDRRYARAAGAPQHSDVLVSGATCENVHVHIGAFRIAQTDGSGLRTAAEELLPQLGRELARPADRENVSPGPGAATSPSSFRSAPAETGSAD